MNTDRDDIITLATILIGSAVFMWVYSTGRGTRNNQNSNNMSNQQLPRGYRNKNPLNIRISAANKWQGEVENNTDGSFEQFVAMEYGYRAALKLIRNYITKDGLTTVAQIISKWAPNNENNTSGYINRVCNTNSWVPAKVIDAYNAQDMADLVYAMAIVENGNTILPDYTQIYKGWALL